MFYLVIIVIGVSWMLGIIILKFNTTKNPIVYKYFTHGTVIELIWTVTPALVLVAIAFPSFRLLYLMDNSYYEVYYNYLALILISKLNNLSIALVLYNEVDSTIFMHFNNYV
jgi:heme/copper-type cytochrome/quinol oxidase subunit 2